MRSKRAKRTQDITAVKAQTPVQLHPSSGASSELDLSKLADDDRALQALKAHTESELIALEKQQNRVLEADERNEAEPPKTRAALQVKTVTAQRLLGPSSRTRIVAVGLMLVSFFFGIVTADWFYNANGRRLLAALDIEFLGPLGPWISQPVANQTQNPKEALVVVAEMLNVRRGPGVEFEIVDVLKKSESIKAQAYDEDWYQIDYGRFVHRQGVVAQALELAKSSFQRLYVWEPVALVREKAEKSAKPMARLTYGSSVLAKVENDHWYALEGGGFVRRFQLGKDKPLDDPQQPFMAKVIGRRVVIVDQPSAPFQRKGVVFRDRKVRVVSIERGWAEIGDGLYIKARYLEKM